MPHPGHSLKESGPWSQNHPETKLPREMSHRTDDAGNPGRRPGGFFPGRARCSPSPEDARYITRHICAGRPPCLGISASRIEKRNQIWICFHGSLFPGICPHPQRTQTLHVMLSSYKGGWRKAKTQKRSVEGSSQQEERPSIQGACSYKSQETVRVVASSHLTSPAPSQGGPEFVAEKGLGHSQAAWVLVSTSKPCFSIWARREGDLTS